MSYEEIWKDIEGYEGIYQVSNKGKVKSLKRIILKSDGKKQLIHERVLQPQDSGHGYYRVNLYKDKKEKSISVHSLVLETFTNKRVKGRVINHIDGDKSNNKLINLEWCTPKENTRHGYENGLMKKGEKHSQAKLKDVQILDIRRIYSEGESSQRYLARKFNVTQATIWRIVNNKSRYDSEVNV
ncbi:NUMOD4 domain-containing protein [Staphylococcus sp. GDY8P72P]|uniref:NUMOD4 domain-containing protein n=1 Tax=Staphylococcus sp. GDY8P72P TaxID=2804425 RepID=UPI00194DE32A